MEVPYVCELRRGQDGRIVEKTETVAGRPTAWTYVYDKSGRLTEAKRDGRTVCAVEYDREGRRLRDYFPHLDTSYRDFAYSLMDNRLQRAGNNLYTHDKSGFRSIWNHGGQYTLYEYAPDYRLMQAEKRETGETFEFAHDGQRRRAAKYRDGRLVEAYGWLDFLRLDGYRHGGSAYHFAYRHSERTPFAMRRHDGAKAYLFYDQVGSLRVVADGDGDVIKEVLYDPFGGIIEDTNPGLRIPIGFAGGLHDPDLGFVRFGWRDYDPFTSRWTAPDPLGDQGGDPDWYGYCLDDPVNGVDPLGLFDITMGDILSTATTVGIEGARQAGKMSSATAGALGIITAPIGDMVSPTKTNSGEDLTVWKMNAAREGYLDVFDTAKEREQRKKLGELDGYKKSFPR